jgi:hypothetical protein
MEKIGMSSDERAWRTWAAERRLGVRLPPSVAQSTWRPQDVARQREAQRRSDRGQR